MPYKKEVSPTEFLFRLSILILSVSLLQVSPIFASGKSKCPVALEVSENHETFIEALKNEDFDTLRELLMFEQTQSIEELGKVSQKELELYKKHWAARNSGPVIQTPLYVLTELAQNMKFKPGESLIDIGSGHGDPALVIGALNPQLKITGFDLVKEKVKWSQKSAEKLGVENVEFITQDLSDPKFKLPIADYYYFFNPVNPEVNHMLAERIRSYSKDRPIKVIIFGGGWSERIFEKKGFKEIASPELHESLRLSVLQFSETR